MPRHRPDSALTPKELERREYMQAYRAANKEHLAALGRTYYETPKERLRESGRAIYARDPVTKREYAKKYRMANKEYLKGWWREHKTGCSPERYAELLKQQNGVCAICGNAESRARRGNAYELSADHDHASGEIRGLLCSNCNLGIGHLRHDMNVLRLAIAYLER